MNFQVEDYCFFVDAMLGTIAKKLRLLGFDTEYSSNIEDQDLINLAKKSHRIIVSKDKQLICTAKYNNIETILVTMDDERDQFVEIFQKINFKKIMIDLEKSRCTKCNQKLTAIEKNKIEDKIPPNVFNFNDKFWICEKCNNVYWEGTHIANQRKFIDSINAELSKTD